MRVIYFLMIVVLSATSCANQRTLSGGPKDVQAPKLAYSEPKSGTLNFSQKRVTLYFDEFVKIANNKAVYVSPPVLKPLKFSGSGKRIAIDIQDTLLPNTTYTIYFGDNVVDINEGNPITNFTYVLSTGPSLDTLNVSTKILAIEDLKPKEGVLVALYKSLVDSLIYKSLPNHFTYSDKSGNANLLNIPEGNFYLIMFDDANRDLKYNTGEALAFLNSPINLTKDTLLAQDILLAKPMDENVSFDYKITSKGSANIFFSSPLNSFYIEPSEKYKSELSFTRDSLFIHLSSKAEKLNIPIEYNGKADTVKLNFSLFKTEIQDLRINCDYSHSQGAIILKFNEPISSFNQNKITVKVDSIKLDIIEIGIKDNPKHLHIKTKDSFDIINIKVALDSAAVESFNGNVNKELGLSIAAKKLSDLTQMSFRFVSADSTTSLPQKNLIVYLESESGQVYRRALVNSSDVLKFSNLSEGSYRLRIIVDEDKNGYWSSVKLNPLTQAEKIIKTEVYQIVKDWEVEDIIIKL